MRVAHSADIVHRDIKPDNMMFNSKRQFKLVDLGLAKRLSDETSHTVTGQSMGTPHFISPEQILGLGEIDARADIYSLGATLYYIATGTVPFDGSSGAHIMSRHLNDPLPDPRHVAPDLSDDFCCILGRMMAKKPEERYQDVQALDRDLYTLQGGGLVTHLGPIETTMQDTVFMPAADLPTTQNKMNWDTADLGRVAAALSEHIGPLAKVLVKKASEKAGSCEELYAELQGHIRTEAGRRAFTAICDEMHNSQQITNISPAVVPDEYGPTVAMESASGETWQTRGSSVSGATSAVGFTLDQKTTVVVTEILAAYVGPVAKVLVKRGVKSSKNMSELVTMLAKNIDHDAHRQNFIAALADISK